MFNKPQAVFTTGTAINDLTFACSAITATSATTISCGGVSTGTPAVGSYKLKSVADTATENPVSFSEVAKQTNAIQYAVAHELRTNANQTIDYTDDKKKTFTVTFSANVGTAPEIIVGTTTLASCTGAEKVVTCTPTKTEMPAAEAANEVKYMNGCTSTSTKVFVTVSSAFSLKASIVAFLALLIL